MKRFFLITLLVAGSLVVINSSSAALLTDFKKQAFKDNVASVANETGTSQASLVELAGNIIRLILGVLGTIFIVLAFIAGNDWMQAAGNEEKVKKAQATIRNLIIGLILVLVAYSLSYVLSSLFTNLLIK